MLNLWLLAVVLPRSDGIVFTVREPWLLVAIPFYAVWIFLLNFRIICRRADNPVLDAGPQLLLVLSERLDV